MNEQWRFRELRIPGRRDPSISIVRSIPIFDDKRCLESCNFCCKTSEPNASKHLLKVFVRSGSLVLGIVSTVRQNVHGIERLVDQILVKLSNRSFASQDPSCSMIHTITAQSRPLVRYHNTRTSLRIPWQQNRMPRSTVRSSLQCWVARWERSRCSFAMHPFQFVVQDLFSCDIVAYEVDQIPSRPR